MGKLYKTPSTVLHLWQSFCYFSSIKQLILVLIRCKVFFTYDSVVEGKKNVLYSYIELVCVSIYIYIYIYIYKQQSFLGVLYSLKDLLREDIKTNTNEKTFTTIFIISTISDTILVYI